MIGPGSDKKIFGIYRLWSLLVTDWWWCQCFAEDELAPNKGLSVQLHPLPTREGNGIFDIKFQRLFSFLHYFSPKIILDMFCWWTLTFTFSFDAWEKWRIQLRWFSRFPYSLRGQGEQMATSILVIYQALCCDTADGWQPCPLMYRSIS